MTKVIQDKAETFTGDPSQTTLTTLNPTGGATKPLAPSGLVAESLSDSSLRYTWVINSDNEDKFEVWTSDTENGTYTLAGTSLAGVPTFDDTGLSGTETRWVHVLATNTVGDSDFSNKDSATTATPLAAPGTPTQFIVVDNENGTADISWLLADTLNTTLEVQIWVQGTTSWDTFVNLDSTPLIEFADSIEIPGSSGAVVNSSGEFGLRVRVSNDTGFDASSSYWVPITDAGATVTAGTVVVSATTSTNINCKFGTLPTNYTGVQLQRVVTTSEGDTGAWGDVVGADTIGELTGAGWDDTVTVDIQYSYRIEVTDGVDTVYTPIQRATATDAGLGFIIHNPDYDDGTLGDDVANKAGTVYSDDRAFSGTQSAKSTFNSGDTKVTGFNYGIPTALVEGDEVWTRMKFFFPTGFSFSSSPGLKTIRIHIVASDGSNSGYLDVYTKSSRELFAQNEITVDGQDKDNFDDQEDRPDLNNNVQLPLNSWVNVETYAKLDSTAGIYRVWIDGTLRFERTTRRTLKTSSDECRQLLTFGFWNGGVPQNQVCYTDDFVMLCTRDQGNGSRILVEDGENNAMIGTAT